MQPRDLPLLCGSYLEGEVAFTWAVCPHLHLGWDLGTVQEGAAGNEAHGVSSWGQQEPGDGARMSQMLRRNGKHFLSHLISATLFPSPPSQHLQGKT